MYVYSIQTGWKAIKHDGQWAMEGIGKQNEANN
jgi:hypothetical protein